MNTLDLIHVDRCSVNMLEGGDCSASNVIPLKRHAVVQQTEDPLWWRVSEVAAYLNLKPKTIRNWLCAGKIKAQRITIKGEKSKRPPVRIWHEDVKRALHK